MKEVFRLSFVGPLGAKPAAILLRFWPQAHERKGKDMIGADSHPQGFSALRSQNKLLFKAFRNHIRACTDENDWGYLLDNNKDGHRIKLRANSKKVINWWVDRYNPDRGLIGRHERWIRPLSLKALEAHCEDAATVYYTSHPSSHYALLMADVDDKDGSAGDANALLDWLGNFIPHMFRQPSTFGRGAHGYFVVHYHDMVLADFRALCERFQEAVGVAAAKAKFRSKFELMGKPGLLRENGTYETMGLLAKFPRLKDHAEIEHYMQVVSNVYSPVALERICEQLAPSIAPNAVETPPLSPPSSPDIDMKTRSSVFISVSERRGSSSTSSNSPDRPALWETDPCKRMNRCGWELAKKLRRAPTQTEIWDAYHAQNLHTGNDHDGNRAKLAADSARWLAAHFDPHKREAFNPADLIPLIATHVTPLVRAAVAKSNRSAYTDEQLAVVLHVIERGATTIHPKPSMQFTAPNNSFVAMFKKLGIELTDSENPDAPRMKLAVMKRALVEAQLASVVDPHWYGGKGKCYGLGPQHPRHADYLAIRKLIFPDGEMLNEESAVLVSSKTALASGSQLSARMATKASFPRGKCLGTQRRTDALSWLGSRTGTVCLSEYWKTVFSWRKVLNVSRPDWGGVSGFHEYKSRLVISNEQLRQWQLHVVVSVDWLQA